jgi:hypothetical protein
LRILHNPGSTLAARHHGLGLGTKLFDAGEIDAEEHVQHLALTIGQVTAHTHSIALGPTSRC